MEVDPPTPQQPLQHDNALAQLLSSFPAASPAASPAAAAGKKSRRPSRTANSGSLDTPGQRSPALGPRASAGKRSRLCFASSDSFSDLSFDASSDGLSDPDLSPNRRGSGSGRRARSFSLARLMRQSSDQQVVPEWDAAGFSEQQDGEQQQQEDGMGGEAMGLEEEAACILLHLKRSAKPQQAAQQPKQRFDAQQQQHMAETGSTLAGQPGCVGDSWAGQAAARATQSLMGSSIPPADLVLACQRWAAHFFSLQAALEAATAAAAAAAAGDVVQGADGAPAPATAGVSPGFPAPHSAAVSGIPGSTDSRPCGSDPFPPNSTSPFAGLADSLRQTPAAAAATAAAGSGEGGAVDPTAGFASLRSQDRQFMSQLQLPGIRTKGAKGQHSPSSLVPAEAAAAAAGVWTPGTSSAQATATPLRPGLLLRSLDAAVLGSGAPSPAGQQLLRSPGEARLHTFTEQESVFSREIGTKISPATQASICAQWAATGRMAVSCGPASKQGMSGIFTLSAEGRPVIWAPRNGQAAARLRALVAAQGGGRAEVPAGYEVLEPKVFEDRAGKAKTHNWQLSIVLTDYFTIITPKSKVPNVKLGHFVRLVGIPTAK